VAIDCKTVHLSGGNQQKAVLAKWLAMRPRLLILDESMRGIDVGVKAELYERIVALADAGLTILLVSSDLEEVMALSDRLIVMRNRRITRMLHREQLSKEARADDDFRRYSGVRQELGPLLRARWTKAVRRLRPAPSQTGSRDNKQQC
jgi:ABC-type sugar transport system ATPase subunit